MRTELYRILTRKRLNGFLEGKLYMNTLAYFRGGTNNLAQSDWQEGTCGTINKDCLRQMGLFYTDDFLKALKNDNVILLSDYYAVNNVFCMYNMIIDDDQKIVFKPDSKNLQFQNGEDEKIVVRITSKEEFYRRIERALKKCVNEHLIEYGIFGNVKYSSAWVTADAIGDRSAFDKELDYSYQNEWRLCVLKCQHSDTPFTLDIGDISDITEEYELSSFLNSPQQIYPGFSLSSDTPALPLETYKTIGTHSCINHLMFSYMGTGTPIVRSDKAQADWHYAQYLILSDKKQEADKYLYDKLIEHRNQEYLELLIQSRLPNDANDAVEAYMMCLNKYPEIANENPERFFFGLHTILMKSNRVVEAAKVFFKAKTQFEFDQDDIICSDLLFALGFYDRVLPLYEEMIKSSKDPIYYYNLAVTNAFLLNFKIAKENIDEYKKYFSHSPKTVERVSKIEKIICCFTENQPITPKEDAFLLQEKFKVKVDSFSNSVLLADSMSLYYLAKNDLLRELSKCKKVIVTPLTVMSLCQKHISSGDLLVYNIIQCLKTMNNLEVVSPSVITFLSMMEKQPYFDDINQMYNALDFELRNNK